MTTDLAATGISIAGRPIGPGRPVYVIAELSGNHGGSLDRALDLVDLAAEAGADAVKLQTYRADTMTIDSPEPWFRIGEGSPWAGRQLFELYEEAATPWEWTEELSARAAKHDMALFSTPFDLSAVEFLERQSMPAYKIASFELPDVALIRRVAQTGMPVIMSTGMATAAEIGEAVGAAREGGCDQLVLLRCTSSYPAPLSDMNLATIADLRQRFGAPVGLSDHTTGITAPIAAVALGACVIEKHFTRSRAEPSPDSAFSLEPQEFRALVDAVRSTEEALGAVRYGPTGAEVGSVALRRSLFVVADMAAGEEFSESTLRAIRPGNGLAPRHLPEILGRRASRAISRGTPLSWDLVS